MSSSSEVPGEAGAQPTPAPPFTAGRFAGRTAIVAGAGSGIGCATALRLAGEGARVVAADLAAGCLEQLVAEFPDLDLVPVAADIASEEAVQAVVAATITWLLSDDAGNVNGAILPSDGGWSAI